MAPKCVSQARMVAAATHHLCDAANALVQGQASEEKLMSAAKEVASSTAQLLVASRVRADADSITMRRLQVRRKRMKTSGYKLLRIIEQFISLFI